MKLSDIFKKKKERIEFIDSGFIQHKRKGLWGSEVIEVHWGEVSAINVFMWDCVSYHSFGFRLILKNGDSVCIHGCDPSWLIFRKRLFSAFPTIDKSTVRKIEESFPSDQELCCWTTS